MPRFDRYMLSQLLAVFGFFSLILVAVYWVNRAVSLFDQIIGSGQTALVFFELSALSLPNVIRIVLPLSAFAATVFVTNRLASESELVVMQATGFSPFRLARPVLVFGLIVAAILSVLAHYLVPASRERFSERSTEISESVSARFLTEGQFLHPSDGITFYIRDISSTGELRDVFLSDNRQPDELTFYTAKRALFARGPQGPLLIMLDGMAQSRDGPTQRLSVMRFEDFTYDIGALMRDDRRIYTDVRSLPTSMLINPSAEVIASLRNPDPSAPFRELQSRLSAPFLAPVAAMIGFATLLLGAFSRFGLWRQVLGAILMLVLVQFLDNAFTNLALEKASYWPAYYAAPLIGALISVAMLAWAGRSRRVRRHPKRSEAAA
ncbi:LPS export ABC transporter permease LptF [Haematobacter massiliensis]|uniref:Permease n=1 Tax=Haematobacter massiliensis TaxID=195105 RepID=A0A086YCL7_9RHOB|nr:LPS export ABC transporter permease LptF [Haematobacter massiliensis]KFI32017.1 permease [Haematobacter massiliensis]OWJ72620.1 LPS export ABC transporter permease LptF [Haematobacter massiliensis]OWJ87960.1 LPS export ABC transporter permease LptF [Haematobacter massiliensis]QBJ24402.1 LPS export ABC transporter permease LptF [Haematobacter massiliensis]